MPLLLPRAFFFFFLGAFPPSVALDVDEHHHVRTPWRFRLAWAGIVRARGQPVASKKDEEDEEAGKFEFQQLGEAEEENESKNQRIKGKRQKSFKEYGLTRSLARSATKADRVATVPVGSRSRRASTTPNETSRGQSSITCQRHRSPPLVAHPSHLVFDSRPAVILGGARQTGTSEQACGESTDYTSAPPQGRSFNPLPSGSLLESAVLCHAGRFHVPQSDGQAI